MLKQLTRAEAGLGFVEEAVGMMLVVAMAAIVNLQIIARYVFAAPFIWPEEVVRLILVWLTFVAAAGLIRRGADIAVDTFVDMMSTRLRRVFHVGRDLILIAVFGFVAVQGRALARAVADMPLVATEWPTALLAWPLVVGGGLIALHAFFRLLRTLFPQQNRSPS